MDALKDAIRIVVERDFGKCSRETDFQIEPSLLAKEDAYVKANKLAAELTGRKGDFEGPALTFG